MTDKAKDNKKPSLGEESGKQDWYRAGALIAAGINIGPGFISPASNAGATAGGVNLQGAPLSGIPGSTCGSGVPTAALLGTGTLEGTNKYSAPILGGAGPYGLVPGFTKPWPGTYATYRIASAHPTHVIAGASLVGQVLGSQWSYESKRNAPSGARAFIQETLELSRTRLLIECLKAVTTFGYRAFEKVFEVRDGMVTLVKLKPLLPELTDILVDDKGNFAGVRNTGVELGPDKVFIYTYDQDGDYFYGRPRLENTRRVWSNWLNTEDQLGRLGSKTSSIIPIMRYPPGQGFDSLGQPRTNYSIAVAMAAGLASGRPIVVPNLAGLQLDDFRNLSEFADKSLWGIDTVDMGNPGPAIEALLKQLQYYDTLMVRGMLRPERSLLEQSRGGGSRADSETHSDIGISDSDMVHADIVAAINEQVVNALLVYNYGDEARDTVRIKAAPLSDDKQLIDQELLGALIKSPQGLAQLIAHTDMQAWMDRLGLPKNEAAGEWDGRMEDSAPGPKAPDAEDKSSALHLARDTYGNDQGHWVTIRGNHVFIPDDVRAGTPIRFELDDDGTPPRPSPPTQPALSKDYVDVQISSLNEALKNYESARDQAAKQGLDHSWLDKQIQVTQLQLKVHDLEKRFKDDAAQGGTNREWLTAQLRATHQELKKAAFDNLKPSAAELLLASYEGYLRGLGEAVWDNIIPHPIDDFNVAREAADKFAGLYYDPNASTVDKVAASSGLTGRCILAVANLVPGVESLGKVAMRGIAKAALIAGLKEAAEGGAEKEIEQAMENAAEQVAKSAVKEEGEKAASVAGEEVVKALAPGQPVPDGLEIVVRGSNTQPNTFLLRPGADTKPLGTVVTPGKSVTIATDLTMDTEIPQMFRRPTTRHGCSARFRHFW